MPSAPIYPRPAQLIVATPPIQFTSFSLSSAMPPHIISLSWCYLILTGRKVAKKASWCRRRAKIMQHHQHRSSPGTKRWIEREVRRAREKQKRPVPQANGFLILSLSRMWVCSPLYTLEAGRRNGETACLRMQNFRLLPRRQFHPTR